MRHSRRGRHSSGEFPSSGEDSFVAVVVTKLTGALLFILLLTMVIMALIPRAADLAATRDSNPSDPAVASSSAVPLQIVTPDALPDAVLGRPYVLALAAAGGKGPYVWSVEGKLPRGLSFDAQAGRLEGTPLDSAAADTTFELTVTAGEEIARRACHVQVLQGGTPLAPLALRRWMEQGFGYLVLMLVWMLGLNVVGSLERWSAARHDGTQSGASMVRFWVYRGAVSVAAVGSAAALAFWLSGSP